MCHDGSQPALAVDVAHQLVDVHERRLELDDKE
jgi:hypothetical protein